MSKLTPETLSTILFATADFHNHCEMEKLWKRAPKSDYLIYYFFQTMSAQYLNVVPTSKRQKTMVWACYFTALLKVSWFQNVLLVALCGPKYQRKNLTNSTLEFEKWSNHKIKAIYNVFNTLKSPYDNMLIIVLYESALILLI